MGLAEKLREVAAAPPESHPRQQCRTCKFYEALDADDRAEFDAWIESGRSRNELRLLCEGFGLSISRAAFGAHIQDHHADQVAKYMVHPLQMCSA